MAKGDEGIILLVIGIVIGLAGAVAASTCTASFFGVCIQYAYREIGLSAAVLGGILFVVGPVILVTKRDANLRKCLAFRAACRPARIRSAAVATCQVCGQPLAWIAVNNHWYCSRCGQYR